jgi:hypothetical protein
MTLFQDRFLTGSEQCGFDPFVAAVHDDEERVIAEQSADDGVHLVLCFDAVAHPRRGVANPDVFTT